MTGDLSGLMFFGDRIEPDGPFSAFKDYLAGLVCFGDRMEFLIGLEVPNLVCLVLSAMVPVFPGAILTFLPLFPLKAPTLADLAPLAALA